MFTLTREFTFSAAHALPHLPEGHKCRRRHGHTYRVVVEVHAGDLDEFGFVVDYAGLDSIDAWLQSSFDHRDLDEVFAERGYRGPTTAERLADLIARVARDGFTESDGRAWVSSVAVSEHASTWVTWRR